MTWTILVKATSVSTSTHILSNHEPGYCSATNELKFGDGVTAFKDLVAIGAGAAGTGDVVGPAGSTVGAIAIYTNASGKAIKNSIPTIDNDGNITAPSFIGNLTGTASIAQLANLAVALQNSRTLSISGDIAGTSGGFNGSANVSLVATLPSIMTAGTYKSLTVNAKGQVISGSNPTTLAGYGITDAASLNHSHSGYQPIDADLTAIAALSDAVTGYLKKTGANTYVVEKDTASVEYVIDGGGAVISTGSKGYIKLPFAGTITGWYIYGNTTGSIVVDVKRSTHSNFPTFTSLAGSELPTLSSAQKNADVSLTTWTTSLAKGDILEFYVNSVSTLTRVTLVVEVTKS